MTTRPRTAFITGGSSGLGYALAARLLSQHYHIFIADISLSGAKELAATHNTPSAIKVHYAGTDVSSWDSQLSAFKQALVVLGGRIDYVFPIAGIGERKWLPFAEESARGEFVKPNLQTLEVDLTGVLYTVALGVQQFRRQEPDPAGWRGKLGLAASICGISPVPALPVYSAAKYGVVGLTRTYGKMLPAEGISVNAVCPGIARTGINSESFYKSVEKDGILASIDGVVDAFVDMIEGSGSAELYVCRPEGYVKKEEEAYDAWLQKSIDVLDEGHRWIQYSESGL
ncbi:NAD(P)-binding protein [Paraphaeosphaeria sporulosa]|uniref:NAD(P)-binding protein n=1 Tax=Paraphaeosphaeria sporulosa TaxID=1460663 RepID=A0A177BXX0_9PLEO|nr:NAD(P)-binding protein [Paraphaeosphaeria sporulosa]OAF99179.1 NAD(P)-binding protein [Paraphaeosphaeria sporulosa]